MIDIYIYRTRAPHKTAKPAETSPKPYKTKQIAARAAETSAKYTKPKKTAKLAATSTKQRNRQRPAETSTKPAQNSETGRDQQRPAQNQHKTAKPAETSRDQPKPAQNSETGRTGRDQERRPASQHKTLADRDLSGGAAAYAPMAPCPLPASDLRLSAFRCALFAALRATPPPSRASNPQHSQRKPAQSAKLRRDQPKTKHNAARAQPDQSQTLKIIKPHTSRDPVPIPVRNTNAARARRPASKAETPQRGSRRTAPKTIQNQANRSESSRDQREHVKLITGYWREPSQNHETQRGSRGPAQNQHKTAKPAETSPKPHKTKP